MDKYKPWKRTAEIPVDLMDLFKKILLYWKQAILCALVCAVALGGYGYRKGRGSPAEDAPKAVGEIELAEDEERAVSQAVELYKSIQAQNEYLDSSILMQIDPYHKDMMVLLYRVGDADRRNLQGILESYISHIKNGGAADALKESGKEDWDVDKSYFTELLSAYVRVDTAAYQVPSNSAGQGSFAAEGYFYVEVSGKDGKMAQRLAQGIQSSLEEKSRLVRRTAGSHELTLLSSEQNRVFDSNLLTNQNEQRAELSSKMASLKATEDAFSEMQSIAYHGLIGGEKAEKGDGPGKEEESGGMGLWMKYLAIGFLAGITVFCGIFTCLYLFRDTVKSVEEIKDLYTFPVYGQVAFNGGKSRHAGKGAGAIQAKSPLQEKERLSSRIGLACKNQGITNICIAAGFPFRDMEKECVGAVVSQLKALGIGATVAENSITDMDAWELMMDAGNVLLACRIGTTTHRMIDEQMQFYQENNIAMAGAMVFCQR